MWHKLADTSLVGERISGSNADVDFLPHSLKDAKIKTYFNNYLKLIAIFIPNVVLEYTYSIRNLSILITPVVFSFFFCFFEWMFKLY